MKNGREKKDQTMNKEKKNREERKAGTAGDAVRKEKRTEERMALKKEMARRTQRSVRRLQFRIEASEQGETVWNYLTRKKGFTKMQVKRMKFQPNGICVDGVQVRVTHVLTEGERLAVSLEAPGKNMQAGGEKDAGLKKEELLKPEKTEIYRKQLPGVLYEDDDVLVAWKPHGITLHPSHGHHGDTFMELVQEMIAARDGGTASDVQLHSIGRLDSDTSGIVVFARNRVAAQRLWQQRLDGRFKKQYLAKCEGKFPGEVGEKQCISRPLAPVPGELNRMQVDSAGKRAVTCCQIWRKLENETWLLLHLETGRTHQIRVHMAWLGHPLVGDSLYGNGTAGKTYAALSACSAVFFQPFTGEKITLNCLDKAERGE